MRQRFRHDGLHLRGNCHSLALVRVVPENSKLDNAEFTHDNIYAAIKLKLSGARGPSH